MSVSKATAVGALELSSTTRPEGKKENKINAHERSEAKTQSNTSSESLVVEDGREQSRERAKRERRKRPANSMHYIFTVSQTGGIVEKRVKPWGKRTEESKVEQLVADG